VDSKSKMDRGTYGGSSPLLMLPHEILHKILSYLDARDLLAAALVNWRLRALCLVRHFFVKFNPFCLQLYVVNG